jgi:hypothetical protein
MWQLIAMAEHIRHQQWEDLVDVTTIAIGDIKDFHVVRHNGTFNAKPLLKHCHMFKGFLLYYRRRCDELSTTLGEEDMLEWKKTHFLDYLGSINYINDARATEGMFSATPAAKHGTSVVKSLDSLTVAEFRRGIKHDRTHYEDLKDDKYFNSWNRGFAATACMHHTQLVLDGTYEPKSDADKAIFKEMQVLCMLC